MRAYSELNLPEPILAEALKICREVCARSKSSGPACVDRGHLCMRCEQLARDGFRANYPTKDDLMLMQDCDLLRIHDDIHKIMTARAVDMKARHKRSAPSPSHPGERT